MARPSKKPEVSLSVNSEVESKDSPPVIPEQVISEPPKQEPKGGPKRSKSPNGFIIEDF